MWTIYKNKLTCYKVERNSNFPLPVSPQQRVAALEVHQMSL